MNKKYNIFCVLIFLSAFCSSQVGVGTSDPKATLDIRANDNETKTLSINTQSNTSDLSNKELLTIYNDGRINVGGILKPNGNAGLPGQYLVSNGPNLPPSWTSLTSNIVINAFQIFFNRYDGESFSSGERVLIKFNLDSKSKMYLDPSANIGEWQGPSYFKISETGTYLVSWNIKLEFGAYPNTVSLPEVISRLYYGSNNYYEIKGVQSTCRSVVCNEFNVSNVETKVALPGATVLLNLQANDYLSIDIKASQNPENNNRLINILLADMTIKKIGL